jgi:hypothetical protein
MLSDDDQRRSGLVYTSPTSPTAQMYSPMASTSLQYSQIYPASHPPSLEDSRSSRLLDPSSSSSNDRASLDSRTSVSSLSLSLSAFNTSNTPPHGRTPYDSEILPQRENESDDVAMQEDASQSCSPPCSQPARPSHRAGPRVTMGPRADCEKCRQKVPGHWMHFD